MNPDYDSLSSLSARKPPRNQGCSIAQSASPPSCIDDNDSCGYNNDIKWAETITDSGGGQSSNTHAANCSSGVVNGTEYALNVPFQPTTPHVYSRSSDDADLSMAQSPILHNNEGRGYAAIAATSSAVKRHYEISHDLATSITQSQVFNGVSHPVQISSSTAYPSRQIPYADSRTDNALLLPMHETLSKFPSQIRYSDWNGWTAPNPQDDGVLKDVSLSGSCLTQTLPEDPGGPPQANCKTDVASRSPTLSIEGLSRTFDVYESTHSPPDSATSVQDSAMSSMYSCDFCGKEYQSAKSLARHCKEKHSPRLEFLCPNRRCKRSVRNFGFTRKEGLERHNKTTCKVVVSTPALRTGPLPLPPVTRGQRQKQILRQTLRPARVQRRARNRPTSVSDGSEGLLQLFKTWFREEIISSLQEENEEGEEGDVRTSDNDS